MLRISSPPPYPLFMGAFLPTHVFDFQWSVKYISYGKGNSMFSCTCVMLNGFPELQTQLYRVQVQEAGLWVIWFNTKRWKNKFYGSFKSHKFF